MDMVDEQPQEVPAAAPPVTFVHTVTATFFASTWGELLDAVDSMSGRFSREAKLSFTQMPRMPDTSDNIDPRVQCITIEEEIKE